MRRLVLHKHNKRSFVELSDGITAEELLRIVFLPIEMAATVTVLGVAIATDQDVAFLRDGDVLRVEELLPEPEHNDATTPEAFFTYFWVIPDTRVDYEGHFKCSLCNRELWNVNSVEAFKAHKESNLHVKKMKWYTEEGVALDEARY